MVADDVAYLFVRFIQLLGCYPERAIKAPFYLLGPQSVELSEVEIACHCKAAARRRSNPSGRDFFAEFTLALAEGKTRGAQ